MKSVTLEFCSSNSELSAFITSCIPEQDCFMLITRGALSCHLAGNKVLLLPKQLHFFSRGARVVLPFEGELSCYLLALNSYIIPMAGFRPKRPPHLHVGLTNAEFKTLRNCLQKALTDDTDEKDLLLVQAFSALTVFCLQTGTALTTNVTSRKAELFRKFASLVSTHFDEQHSVGFYADKLCITPGYLNKVVRAINFIPPKEFILRYILEQAKTLLVSSDLPVDAIAYQVGFQEPGSFSTLFKKYIGISPKEFRAQK